MQDNKGFTLIETLFSFSIMMILTIVSVPLINLSLTPSLARQADQIIVYVNYAKSYAISAHQRVELKFDGQKMSLTCENVIIDEYHLSKGEFSKSLNIWFNEKGNINQANSLFLKNNNEQVKLTFNLGTGNCYAK